MRRHQLFVRAKNGRPSLARTAVDRHPILVTAQQLGYSAAELGTACLLRAPGRRLIVLLLVPNSNADPIPRGRTTRGDRAR
jgi:hypothetical protein